MSESKVRTVIATIIIIAVTIAIAVAVAYWIGGISNWFESHPPIKYVRTDFYISILPNESSPYWINITSGVGAEVFLDAHTNYRYIQTINNPYDCVIINSDWVSIEVFSLDGVSEFQLWILNQSQLVAYSGVCTHYEFSNFRG